MNQDAYASPELTERQLKILAALIRAYTQHPEPISSKQLVEDYDLGVSSATIRNEMAVLEQLGMIRAPHTSAGRIPTEEGYRYFVGHLLNDQELDDPEQLTIRTELDQNVQDIQKLARTAVALLARSTQAAALITEPRARSPRFKHLQLISTQGRLVLMIIVLEGGEVLQQMLTLAETLEQERLTQISTVINTTLTGENAERIRSRTRSYSDTLLEEVLELLADTLTDTTRDYVIHSFGFSNILPEFDENIGAQQALRVLEGSISHMITETIESENDDPVRVIVGGDGRFEEISHLGLVIGRYGTGQLVGALSVVGPTRLRYGRAISTVRYISTLMSSLLKDLYGNNG